MPANVICKMVSMLSIGRWACLTQSSSSHRLDARCHFMILYNTYIIGWDVENDSPLWLQILMRLFICVVWLIGPHLFRFMLSKSTHHSIHHPSIMQNWHKNVDVHNGNKTTLTVVLTHWGQDKMDAISQTTFWSAFSWMKMFEFRLNFHWSLFLRVRLTIFQHWFR